MSEAGICTDGRLAEEVAATLPPPLQDALNHPSRRDILRVLQASEQPCGVTWILDRLPSLKRGEVRYHLQVLQGAGAVLGDGPLSDIGGGDALYWSALADDHKALAALRATEREDRRCRQGSKGRSSGLLTMFRVPRPERTISLSNLLGRKADREE